MPQTIFALLSVMVATLFAFQQQQAAVRSQLSMIGNEVSTQAMGVVAEVLENVADVAFDEWTKDAAALVPADQLTRPQDFGSNAGYAAFDDVDDFHGMQHVITREVTNPETGMPTEVAYEVTATVRYMTEGPSGQLAPSLTPTYLKLVELTVQGPEINGRRPFAQMSRLYTYPD